LGLGKSRTLNSSTGYLIVNSTMGFFMSRNPLSYTLNRNRFFLAAFSGSFCWQWAFFTVYIIIFNINICGPWSFSFAWYAHNPPNLNQNKKSLS